MAKGQVWIAPLQPLQDRITQYLRIERSQSGTLTAFLVNPEYNLGRGIRYDVALNGDAIVLTKPKQKGWALNGRLDEDTGQLHIDWQGIGVFPFTRRDRDNAIGYYAQYPGGLGTGLPGAGPCRGWLDHRVARRRRHAVPPR